MEKNQTLSFIHFNDVYDIESTNNCGGVARFYTALKKYEQDQRMILFSGDLFSPSHCNFF